MSAAHQTRRSGQRTSPRLCKVRLLRIAAVAHGPRWSREPSKAEDDCCQPFLAIHSRRSMTLCLNRGRIEDQSCKCSGHASGRRKQPFSYQTAAYQCCGLHQGQQCAGQRPLQSSASSGRAIGTTGPNRPFIDCSTCCSRIPLCGHSPRQQNEQGCELKGCG
mgnify:CR=1 FL=1